MKTEFLGVGEAFDPDFSNSSVLVHSETKLLIDCGYIVPQVFFRKDYDPNFLDAVYLTHFHGDHTLGLPALLVRAHEEKRKKTLTFIGQPGIKDFVHKLLDLAYPGTRTRFSFDLAFIESSDAASFNELELSFAQTTHSLRNFAVKVSAHGKSLAVSGDGSSTEDSRRLFSGCSLLIHEAFGFEGTVANHATAEEILSFSRDLAELKTLAFIHIQRSARKNSQRDIERLNEISPLNLLVPNVGDVIDV